eukprot:6323039-Amphidinium_carterae.1
MDALRNTLGSSIPVHLLRVGEAFAHVRGSDVELFDSLFVPDDLHTSCRGSYLAAWVFVRQLISMGLPESRVARSYVPGSHDSVGRLHCDFRKDPPWQPSDDVQLQTWPETPLLDIDEDLARALQEFAAIATEPS